MPTLARCVRTALVIAFVGLSTNVSAAPIVVETPALTPAQQKAKFHLPPGFEIQLVAAEPDIGKPMNLSFDARGRLWVTHSLEYPFPTAGEGVQPRDLNQDKITEHAPRDHLSYFESIGPDGRGGRLVHFAEGLNIPIGQLPLVWSHDQTAALGYSIPSLKLYQRGTGDGLANDARVLFTGFGNVDTHGMCNSFTRGFDGWVYACHGFRNTSRLSRPGGAELLVLNSGNTIRFLPDGSKLEQFTKGQVNPFGMTIDTWGNVYNADCHSMPVTCLLRGATYQSFGKPDDGLGFGPNMIDHNHGSTGICGVACYDAPQFPADYQQNLFICNPVNGQVHRDKLVWTGSSPKVDTQPEFITCDDGWFRPVDVKLGPDGALYIADFYNAIIGHYEAPLQHPLRDRTHARIWRVVYTGEKNDQVVPALVDYTTKSLAELVQLLGDKNFAVRMLVTNLLVDRVWAPVGNGVPIEINRSSVQKQLLEALHTSGTAHANRRVHAAWAWTRLQRADEVVIPDPIEALTGDPEPIVRVHAARILGGKSSTATNPDERAALTKLLRDPDARVQRAAVEAISLNPDGIELESVLAALEEAKRGDTHLEYAIRIALREMLLRNLKVASSFGAMSLERQRALAGVANAVNPASPEYAAWLRGLVIAQAGADSTVPRAEWRQWIKPAARYSDGRDFDELVDVVQKAAGEELDDVLAAARACQAGCQAGGKPVPASLSKWAEDVALRLLGQVTVVKNRWAYRPLPGERRKASPFGTQPRPMTGRRGRPVLFSSLPGGEDETGINRSPEFVVPKTLSFWLAGHNGFPQTPDRRVNVVRLVDAKSGAVLKEAFPPRTDAAVEVVWNLDDVAGRNGAIEIVDANDESAYAWVAAGRFSLAELNPPTFDAGPAAVALIKDFKLASLQPRLESMLQVDDDGTVRNHAAQALVALQPDAGVSALLLWADEPEVPAPVQSQLWTAIRTRESAAVTGALRELLAGAALERQRKVADALVVDRSGAERLLALATEGRLSPQLLQQPALKFKIAVLNVPELNERVIELTKSLPPPDQQLNTLIAQRKALFKAEKCSTENGKAAFIKRCAVCHQVGTEGAKVGPQLDGVGIRGLDRLLEDTLDPNRNVDAAFRSSAIALADGRILTGLKRREEGTEIIFANNEGKEFRVPAAEIEEMKLSPTSLMPGNFGESIPAEEMADILAWMLTQKPAVK